MWVQGSAESLLSDAKEQHNLGGVQGYMDNKATRSPEISRQQVQKLTPQFCFYIYWI